MEEDDLEPAGSTFGKVLRQLRREKELTQAQLAQEVGTSQQNIQGIEAGKSAPGHEIYQRMLDFFGHESLLATVPPKQPQRTTAFFHRAREMLAEAGIDPDDPQGLEDDALRRLRNMSMRPAPPATPAESLATRLAAMLPVELRDNVNRRVKLSWMPTAYRADYLSKRYCIEIKSPSNLNTVTAAARHGMQQLHIFNIGLREQSLADMQPTPKLVLLVLVPNMDVNEARGSRLSRADVIRREAHAMGIVVGFQPSIEALARTIIHLEKPDIQNLPLQEEPEDYDE